MEPALDKNPEGKQMDVLQTRLKRMALIAGMCLLTCASSGCKLLGEGVIAQSLNLSKFWVTTPLIPVSPY